MVLRMCILSIIIVCTSAKSTMLTIFNLTDNCKTIIHVHVHILHFNMLLDEIIAIN